MQKFVNRFPRETKLEEKVFENKHLGKKFWKRYRKILGKMFWKQKIVNKV